MNAQDRFFVALRWVRFAGLTVLGLIVLAGAPKVARADGGCDYYVFRCTNEAEECVEHLHDACPPWGECEYEHQCRASVHYPDCPEYEYIDMCEEDEPN